MKRMICLVCLLGFLLCGCAAEEPSDPPVIPAPDDYSGTYQLTFQEKLISNDSVGNDWSFTYTYNDQPIKSGYTVTQPLGTISFQSVGVEVRENDKFDDVGKGTLYIAVWDGGSGKTRIAVTETNGKYKDNTAVWEIACGVTLVENQ